MKRNIEMQQVLEKRKSLMLLALGLMPVLLFGQKGGSLLEQELFDDFSTTPIYNRLVIEEAGETKWQQEYAYLDSIEIFRIRYLSDSLKITGFMVQPKEPGKYPCLIYNRGGNRDFGELKVFHAISIMGKLASHGYVVIASNYRGNGGSEGTEEFGGADVNDVLQLVNTLGEIEAADTSKIGMIGWSRGGMMTYLALAQTDRIKAAVVGGALADLTTGDRPEMEENVYRELIPGYESNKQEVLTQRSAVFWAEKLPATTPILILHGNSDWRVKSSQSMRMATALDEHRRPYRLIVYEGSDHGISEHREEVMEETLHWFDRYLVKGEALPDMEYHGR